MSSSASSAIGAMEGSGDETAAAVDVEGFGSGFTAGTMAPVETSSIYKYIYIKNGADLRCLFWTSGVV